MMNLLAFLLERREPVPWFEIHENVEGYARALAPKELVEEVKKQCDEMLRLYE